MQKKDNLIDTQILLSNYFDIKNFNFRTPFNQNPLVNLYQKKRDDVIFPDLAFTNENNTICNKLFHNFPNTIDRKPVNCVRIFSYSKKIIGGTASGNLILYDLNQLSNPIKIPAHQSSIRAIQFTKNENYILTGDNAGNIIYFVNGDSGLNQKTKIKAHKEKESVTDISFSVSDNKYVTSSDDKTAKIFDFATGLDELTFTDHGSDIKTCDWNPIKSLVATGGKDHLIKLWDPRSGESISSLHIHKNTINRLRFNKNGNWLLSASKDHCVKITDVRNMKELQIYKGHEQEVNTICWHPKIEDIFCSAGADGCVIFWNASDNKNFVIKNAHEKEIFDLSFNPIGNILVSSGNDASLKVWQRNPNFN